MITRKELEQIYCDYSIVACQQGNDRWYEVPELIFPVRATTVAQAQAYIQDELEFLG